ncbi:dihydroorotate dehydrogenase PyrD [Desulfurococcus mucosus]|uniref:Dihydroorotate dehydrogenase n=1 Tax=Desulfurococcus mucosus (strain ATCC 35584 / DSM 2162 / JCM 9187 / O7/1) TaxID=765177 RepID=E8R8P5_DESM0|nr:dihydroorotate dehydrogenase PyrD [Desulfurococcus mucosus]ADV64871.1 dihydroorotate oxidase B, catalytic subunit [Desulfurococcus mucosus DSM 2162]
MLEVSVAGLRLEHPVMNASGILGSEPEHLEILAGYGFSALVSKTITLKPREGYPPPIIVELRNKGLLNAVGLANPGVEAIGGLAKAARRLGKPLVLSIGGGGIDEFVKLAEAASEAGVDAVELNLSCPHARGYGLELGGDPALVYTIVKNTVSVSSAPVVAKLGLSDRIMESAGKALEGGAKALTLINTVKAMAIDVYSRKPVLSNKHGGLSGPPIHPIAVRVVYDVYREYRAEVIGVGGVSSWIDAAELILAGARAIQVGTAVLFNEKVVEEINKGLREWVSTLGYRRLEELVGTAVE